MMKICFASHNSNKIRELNDLVGPSYQVIGLAELGVEEEIVEDGDTLEANSRIKATYVYERFNTPVFADDSGLLVDHLNGAPGVHSARYAGPQKKDEDNMDLLLENLMHQENRKAEFRTVITFIDQKGTEKQFSGSIAGTITHSKRGVNGFGYDPVFQPIGHDLTFAELSSEMKNKISHRAKAVEKLIHYLHQIK